jgi:thiosulfate/3-mercaptopyruvate sulfurtransferase
MPSTMSIFLRFRRPGLAIHLRYPAKRMLSMSYRPYVLSPVQLKEMLSTDSKNDVALLDVSWHMPNSSRNAEKEYAERHIETARRLDLDEVASPHELGLKHMMPTPETFAKACGTRSS